jgi:hypothetical protein
MLFQRPAFGPASEFLAHLFAVIKRYNIKAQFKEATGTGIRDQGLGIVGRPCTFDLAKQ